MKTKIYLETSVIGAYLDNGDPFRRDLTIRWWEHERPHYDAYVAPLVVRELERTPEPHRSAYLNLIRDLPQLDLIEEVGMIAEGYLGRGIFQRKFMADAVHVALASFHRMDLLVTWNFGYLANIYRQARVKMFNATAGFHVPQIITPEFLVDHLG